MPAEPVERDGMRHDPPPARLGTGQGLVFHLYRLGPADGADDRAECCWINATHGRRRRGVGREIGDPGVLSVKDPVRDRAQLGKVATGVGLEEVRLEAWAADIGPRALVVDHVVRCEADVAVQVGGRLVYRDPELIHQIAAVHMSLPEQAELDELKALLDARAKFPPVVFHYAPWLGQCAP